MKWKYEITSITKWNINENTIKDEGANQKSKTI